MSERDDTPRCVHALGLVRCGSTDLLEGTDSCARCATAYDWRLHRRATATID